MIRCYTTYVSQFVILWGNIFPNRPPSINTEKFKRLTNTIEITRTCKNLNIYILNNEQPNIGSKIVWAHSCTANWIFQVELYFYISLERSKCIQCLGCSLPIWKTSSNSMLVDGDIQDLIKLGHVLLVFLQIHMSVCVWILNSLL